MDPRSPHDRVATRILRAFAGQQIAGALLTAVTFLGLGVFWWRQSPPAASAHGRAFHRAEANARESMMWMNVVFGAVLLVLGLIGGYFLLRSIRHERDGKWG